MLENLVSQHFCGTRSGRSRRFPLAPPASHAGARDPSLPTPDLDIWHQERLRPLQRAWAERQITAIR